MYVLTVNLYVCTYSKPLCLHLQQPIYNVFTVNLYVSCLAFSLITQQLRFYQFVVLYKKCQIKLKTCSLINFNCYFCSSRIYTDNILYNGGLLLGELKSKQMKAVS